MHALHEFIQEHPAEYQAWLSNPYLGFLSVKDEQQLNLLRDKLKNKGIKTSSFLEPDMDNQFTALAVEPGEESARWLSSLPLALKEINCAADCCTNKKEAA